MTAAAVLAATLITTTPLAPSGVTLGDLSRFTLPQPFVLAVPEKPIPADLNAQILLQFGLQMADLATTQRTLGAGGYEANPLMQPFTDPVAMTAVKVLFGLGSLATHVKWAREHPNRARLVLGLFNAGMVFVVWHNSRTFRALEAKQ